MDTKYEIVRFHPDLKAQVVELQTHLWSPDLSVNASYFEWKYEHNPYVKEQLVYLALCGGKVVGMRGFFGTQWECGEPSSPFTLLYADDMVIAPEHRDHGLMSKIMAFAFKDLAAKEYEYAINLSAGLVTLRSSLAMGWRSAGWVRPMRRRHWPTVLQDSVLHRLRRLPVLSDKLTSLPTARFERPSPSIKQCDLKEIGSSLEGISALSIEDTPRCTAMAELVVRKGSTGRIRHVRDSVYFRWRFQNPLSRYRYIFLGKDRLDAYLVLQEYKSEYANRRALNIVSWEASNASDEELLFKIVLKAFARGRELTLWSATLPDSMISFLSKRGFRFLSPPENVPHFPPAILVRPITDYANSPWALAGRQLLDLKAWDLQMLYSMHG